MKRAMSVRRLVGLAILALAIAGLASALIV
jgi:hypothetical protein